MFWNKKSSIEKQKETRLTILQLEKLIERAINNVNDAVSAFDTSRNSKYSLLRTSKENFADMFKAQFEFVSTYKFVEANKDVLLEMKSIIDGREIQSPKIIKAKLNSIREKHEKVVIMMKVAIDALKGEKDEDLVSHLVRMKSFDNDRREELVDLLTALNDFQGLFRGHFSVSTFEYVPENRLYELRSIESNDFDLLKLIRLGEELNSAYQNHDYLSVAMLVRAILDHVPPIFGFKSFVEVSNNYGGKSLKKSLQNLQNSSRNIADTYLHQPIRNKESLPNETQVNFRNDLDVLLAEIVRILK